MSDADVIEVVFTKDELKIVNDALTAYFKLGKFHVYTNKRRVEEGLRIIEVGMKVSGIIDEWKIKDVTEHGSVSTTSH